VKALEHFELVSMNGYVWLQVLGASFEPHLGTRWWPSIHLMTPPILWANNLRNKGVDSIRFDNTKHTQATPRGKRETSQRGLSNKRKGKVHVGLWSWKRLLVFLRQVNFTSPRILTHGHHCVAGYPWRRICRNDGRRRPLLLWDFIFPRLRVSFVRSPSPRRHRRSMPIVFFEEFLLARYAAHHDMQLPGVRKMNLRSGKVDWVVVGEREMEG